ncbi:hypothetical protein GCM10027021_26080 [Dyella kyungheensis]
MNAQVRARVRVQTPAQALLSLAEHTFAQPMAPIVTTTRLSGALGATVCHGPRRVPDTPLTSAAPRHAAGMTTLIREAFFRSAPAHIYVYGRMAAAAPQHRVRVRAYGPHAYNSAIPCPHHVSAKAQ